MLYLKGHINGTPFRKPENNGGSPIGDKHPPMLQTINIKKTILYGFILFLFIFMYGFIKSIAAPVVPIIFASIAPQSRIIVLTNGVPVLLIFRLIPPEITYKTTIKIINSKYSMNDSVMVAMSFMINKFEKIVIELKSKIIFL